MAYTILRDKEFSDFLRDHKLDIASICSEFPELYSNAKRDDEVRVFHNIPIWLGEFGDLGHVYIYGSATVKSPDGFTYEYGLMAGYVVTPNSLVNRIIWHHHDSWQLVEIT